MTRRSFSGAAAAAVAMSGPLAAEVRPDSGGMLVIHGRRRFVVGLYQLPKIADPWPEVRDAGFNLVHVGASREELDLAARHQLYGWVTVGSIAPPSRSADESRIRNIVESCKDHPALLFWETEDEPSYQWKKPGARIPPENIIAARRLLKKLLAGTAGLPDEFTARQVRNKGWSGMTKPEEADAVCGVFYSHG